MIDSLSIRSITGPDINNGLGVRLTIWVQGCSHNCKGCQNPSTHEYTKDECIGADEAFHIILKEITKKDNNGKYIYDGITLSGGDPLDQCPSVLRELCDLVDNIRSVRPNINLWIYTGFTYTDLVRNDYTKYILDRLNPNVIVDGKFMRQYKPTDPNVCPWRGSTNQHLIDYKASHEAGSIVEFELPNDNI